MIWTAERVDLLTSLWNKGLSASLIASKMGQLTKNAVIGKISRLGLSRTQPIRLNKKPAAPRQKKRQATPRCQPKPPNGKQSPPSPLKVDDHKIPLTQRKTFEQLQSGICKYPIGDPKDPDFFFCGAPCNQMVPYCDAHAQRCRQLK